MTRDGVLIEVAANVARVDAVDAAVTAGADGIGLFRTEFLFLDRETMPTVEEQTATTNEMSRNVTEAATGSGEIAANIAGVAGAAEQTTQGVGQSTQAITELARMSSDLRELVGRFTV